MADQNGVDYFRMRERQERERADGCADRAVGRIHLDMAERYAALIAEAAVPALPSAPADGAIAAGRAGRPVDLV